MSEIHVKTAEALRLRKARLFQELTKLNDSLKGSLTPLNAEIALRSCLKYEANFEKLIEEIFTLNPYLVEREQVPTKDLDAFQTIIDGIIKRCYIAKSKASPTTPHETDDAALPKIGLPSWDGNVATWSDFKTQFDSVIASRKNLTGSCKLKYLRSTLSGEPASIVNQFEVSDESYELAYRELIRRYENKRRLASYFLNKILNFKPDQSSEKEHAKFLEIHRSATTSLTRLRIDLSDYLLFELCFRNLRPRDRRKFNIDHDSDAVPTLQDLFTFVENFARSDELETDVEPPTQSKPRQSDRLGSRGTPVKRSLVVAKKPVSCIHCKGDHMVYRCSKFLALSVNDRKAVVEKQGRCIACLYNHSVKVCTSRFGCKVCGSKEHNTLLHPEEKSSRMTSLAPASSSSPTRDENTLAMLCNNCLTPGSGPAVLLGTIQCRIQDNWGQEVKVRAVLDPGSEISVVTSSLANLLGLPRSPPSCHVEGIGRNLKKSHGSVTLQISSIHPPFVNHTVHAAVLPGICDQLPKSRLPKILLEKFQSLELADPDFIEPGRIHLLLGAEVYSDLLSGEEPTVIPGNPSAIRTKFGYVVIGRTQMSPSGAEEPALSLCLATVPLDESIRRFWEVEETAPEIPEDPNDAQCERHFQATHQRAPDGRFVVRLPFLPDAAPLGSNLEMAMKRLEGLERKLKKNASLSEAYENCLQEYIDLQHISPTSHKFSYLLPHHAVFKESSSTTKCRVVFDCSAPDDRGLSLNDRLYRGPPLLNDVSLLLISFRFFKICLMADIKMMYRMVAIHPEDKKCLVIAWRQEQYHMNRLPFGLKPAGYIAGRCVLELANLYSSEFPAAAKAIRENRYADDFCTGADTLEEAQELRSQLIKLLSRGGFEIRRWASNVPEALSDVPELFRETPVKLPSGETGIKVLGVMWDQTNDAFVARVVQFDSQLVSKRTVLSYIARIYDIMGFFSPTIFLAKHFIQRLWLHQLEWDQPLPPALAEEWRNYASSLASLADIKIPRLLPVLSSRIRLVGFSDASEKGMAAALYLHWSRDGSPGQARLLKSKTKLAPLKTLTIPRLELCGALLLTKLVKTILEWSGVRFETVNLYTDSQIVLAWLDRSPHELKVFVGNRVAEIHRNVPAGVWGHVLGSENPADLGSRGLPANLLKSSDLWWRGPSFLTQPYELWPGKPPDVCPPDRLPEVKDNLTLNLQSVDPEDAIVRRFSSFIKMQRVLAYVWRFANKARRRETQILRGPLTTFELKNALYVALRLSQKEAFGPEIERIKEGKSLSKELQKLSPFFDRRVGVVRVGGRLGRASFLPEDAKHPFLLAKGCHLSTLICDHFHSLYLHSGPRTTCAAIQRQFWILSLMTLVKARIHRCRICHRLNSRPSQPIMADVIPARLDQTYCWSNCAMDFGGPFSIKESKMKKSTVHKSYVCVFVCLTTRAVHLEMVTDLTTEAFLAAFSRFTARRSAPSVIYTDRGTNFVGARGVLREIREFLSSHQEELLSAAAAVGTRWRLNAPYSPNFNGCAESCVKSVKALLVRQVGEQVLTFEEFSTLLCRVEQVLNSRPISFSSRDIKDRDVVYLTPGHFITGREMMVPPEEHLDDNVNLWDRWRRIRQMSQVFWRTWSTAYLHELMQRQKWTKGGKNVKVGDLVYVTGVRTTPLSWPIGRVMETFTNPSDTTVRVARVRVRDRDLVRPASKLVIIPTDE